MKKRINLRSKSLDDILIHGFDLIMDESHLRVSSSVMPNGEVKEVVCVCLGKPKNEEFKRFESVASGVVSIYNFLWKNKKERTPIEFAYTIFETIRAIFNRTIGLLEDEGVLPLYTHVDKVNEKVTELIEKYKNKRVSRRRFIEDLKEIVHEVLGTKIWYKDRVLTLGDFVAELIYNGVKEVLEDAWRNGKKIKGVKEEEVAVVEKVHPTFFKGWYRIRVRTENGTYNFYVKV